MLTAKELIDAAKESTDISPEIPDSLYILWLNTLQGQIYSTDVCSLAVCDIDTVYDDGKRYFTLSELGEEGRAAVRACDIETIISCDEAFAKSDAASVGLFPDRAQFYDEGEKIYLYHPSEAGVCCRVIYREMPALLDDSNITTEKLAVPDEHLELPLSYLVGKAYEYANEDAQAAKWLGGYNACLEAFEKWHALKKGSMRGICT